MLAYIDPGSGAFILQILAAMGLGTLFYSKKIFLLIKGIFVKRKDKKKDSSHEHS